MSTTQTVVMLPPEALLTDENIRFGLKKFRVDSLAENIADLGGVQTPLKINPLPELGPNGEQYRVREGHYRHAAVTKLNKANGAVYTLPCIVEEDAAEGLDRMKRQLSENMERNELSPMDIAVAIQKLQGAGLANVDIRKVFSRPGGRKGLSMQPISNSLLNIYVRFLDFPKDVQNKIHDGRVGVAAAMELHKVWEKFPELTATEMGPKWASILDAAEKDRQDALDEEEKSEEKFLEAQKKAADREAKEKAEADALKTATDLLDKTAEETTKRLDESSKAYAAMNAIPKTDKDARKAAEAEFKAKEKAADEAQKSLISAKATAEKLKEKALKAEQVASERKAKLEQARAEAADKAVKPAAVKKAAAAATDGKVPLNNSQIKQLIKDLGLPGFAKVQAIGQSIQRAVDSTITDQQLIAELAYITGERKAKPSTMKG